MSEQDWRAAGERIDALLAASASSGAVARERAEELVRIVADVYGAGLERLLELAHQRGALTGEVLDALAADDLVASLLLVHGLHPYGVETRIEKALDGVRPYLGSHGGDVEFLGVTSEGVARLRLLGSCDGCPSSSVTLKLAVEGAIEAAAPEVVAIEVEDPKPAGAVIPVTALFSRLAESAQDTGSAWTPIPALVALGPGAVTTVLAGSVPVLACRAGTELYAFRDSCARCGQSLEGAVLARLLGGGPGDVALRCAGCGARYDVRRAGACLDEEALHLTPLPLLADGATVSVAVPAPVPT